MAHVFKNKKKKKKKTMHPSAYITVATRSLRALDKTSVLESLISAAFYHKRKRSIRQVETDIQNAFAKWSICKKMSISIWFQTFIAKK